MQRVSLIFLLLVCEVFSFFSNQCERKLSRTKEASERQTVISLIQLKRHLCAKMLGDKEKKTLVERTVNRFTTRGSEN